MWFESSKGKREHLLSALTDALKSENFNPSDAMGFQFSLVEFLLSKMNLLKPSDSTTSSETLSSISSLGLIVFPAQKSESMPTRGENINSNSKSSS